MARGGEGAHFGVSSAGRAHQDGLDDAGLPGVAGGAGLLRAGAAGGLRLVD